MQAGTKTLFFSDIEGSTRLLHSLGEDWPEVLERHREIVRAAIGRHGGEEQGTEGDSFFVLFDRAGDACTAALEVQRGLQAERWPQDESVSVRIGIHSGEVSRASDQGALVGIAIHLAARIAAAGHGGQIVLSEATRLLAEDALPAEASIIPLGSHLLKDIGRPVVLHQLSDPDRATSFPRLRSLDAPRHNMPAPATSYVGGTQSIDAVADALEASRLVTLTGAGGCGKTRLALEVGRSRLETHRDGVWFVELGSAADGERVAHAVAEALELRPEPGQPLVRALVTYLRPLEILLVLDNCEHLVEDCCALVTTLLRDCEGVRVLATSRELLGLDGETSWRVASLQLPSADEDEPSAIAATASVELFLDRSRAADPEFRPAPNDVAAIAAICTRLDGIPLAIELAASRASVMDVSELAARLEQSFKVLSGGRRGALPRQQTIDATVEWSYRLLGEDERSVLRRLSVFRRGATMEAAEAVCALPDDDIDVFEVVADLVRKSLLQRERTRTATRYRMLEPVRQFALARLLAEEDPTAARDRHRDYFLVRASDLGRRFDDGRLDGALLEYLDEIENFRGAFEWAATVGPPEAVVRLVAGLGDALAHAASQEERQAMCHEALAVDPSVAPEARIDVLYTASWFANAAELKQLLDEAGQLAERLVDQARVLRVNAARLVRSASAVPFFAPEEDLAELNAEFDRFRPHIAELSPSWRARYYYGLCWARHRIGDYAGTTAAIAEGVALGEEAGLVQCYLLYLAGAHALYRQGDEAEAARYWEAALAVCDRDGPMHGQAYALHGLGDLRVRQGDSAGGLSMLREAAAIVRRRGVVYDIGMLAGRLARALVELGLLEEARPLTAELLSLTKGLQPYARAEPLLAAGLLAEADGDVSEARRCFEEVSIFPASPAGVVERIAQEGLARVAGHDHGETSLSIDAEHAAEIGAAARLATGPDPVPVSLRDL